eukprot:Clim_evm14s26 gene=Clim_evmTU14s26
MLRQTAIDIANTNIANLGTDLEKQVKLAAAENEPAWTNAGKEVGLMVWRIEKFQVVAWPKEEYGNFYSGDSYIVLNTYKSKEGDKLLHDVHFWIGQKSTQDEYGTAAYKTVELDDILGGVPVQHRELQNAESALFQSYFPQMEVLDGGIDSGFRHVEPEKAVHRLLQVKGKKNVVVREVPKAASSLNSGDVFILDLGMTIIQWNGSASGGMERVKAAEFCRALDAQRKELPEVYVIDEADNDSHAKTFWAEVDGEKSDVKSAEEGGADSNVKANMRLFKLSDATGEMTFTECSVVAREALDSDDVFIVDVGHDVFVWVGSGASKQERQKAMQYGAEYLAKYGSNKSASLTRIIEGHESTLFKKALPEA